MAEFFEFMGKAATLIATIIAGWWGIVSWRKRNELFPRVYFEVSANFVGRHREKLVTEIVAVLENKGIVPLKIKHFGFKVRALTKDDALVLGDEKIRKQLLFPHVVAEGVFVPESWDYSFVFPGVRTEYTFVTAVPTDAAFLRVQADFEYLEHAGQSHHAAKILKVPDAGVGKPAVIAEAPNGPASSA
jgi:hypothetical protein